MSSLDADAASVAPIRRWKCQFLVGVVLALVAACSGPAYKTDFFTLVADQDTEQRVAQPYRGSLGVGPVKLPELLDHPGVVSESGGQQIEVAPYAVWAGDLNAAVVRVLADNLSAYLGTDQVWPFPWDNRARPEQQIRVVFEKFSGERGGDVVLQAKWRLLSSNGGEELRAEKFSARISAADKSYEAYVAALNDLLNQLSEAIALAVAED